MTPPLRHPPATSYSTVHSASTDIPSLLRAVLDRFGSRRGSHPGPVTVSARWPATRATAMVSSLASGRHAAEAKSPRNGGRPREEARVPKAPPSAYSTAVDAEDPDRGPHGRLLAAGLTGDTSCSTS